MRRIQECALDLFDERGFAAVTIEEIAAAAESSPATVYRYFGTKEGLLVADEFDSLSDEGLAEILDVKDPVGSLVRIVRAYEEVPDEGAGVPLAARRVRYFFMEASVRKAVLASLDRAARRIAPLLAAGGMEQLPARVAANALAFGYFAALEQWFLDGGERPIAEYVQAGMAPLDGIWPPPREPGTIEFVHSL